MKDEYELAPAPRKTKDEDDDDQNVIEFEANYRGFKGRMAGDWLEKKAGVVAIAVVLLMTLAAMAMFFVVRIWGLL